jgi:hypothetical protein
MRIMNVAPMHRTIGMDAEFSNLTKFPKVRKLLLNRLMRTHSARSTATGAHLRQCPRRVPFSAETGFKCVLLPGGRFPFPSFPRMRESIVDTVKVDPRFRGDDGLLFR